MRHRSADRQAFARRRSCGSKPTIIFFRGTRRLNSRRAHPARAAYRQDETQVQPVCTRTHVADHIPHCVSGCTSISMTSRMVLMALLPRSARESDSDHSLTAIRFLLTKTDGFDRESDSDHSLTAIRYPLRANQDRRPRRCSRPGRAGRQHSSSASSPRARPARRYRDHRGHPLDESGRLRRGSAPGKHMSSARRLCGMQMQPQHRHLLRGPEACICRIATGQHPA